MILPMISGAMFAMHVSKMEQNIVQSVTNVYQSLIITVTGLTHVLVEQITISSLTA